MKLEIKLDPECAEPKIVICAQSMTPEISALVKRLSDTQSAFLLAGFRGETVQLLDMADVVRVYASGGKVYAVTQAGEYQLRLRLYELEEKLDADSFVRISNSEIINLKKARRFDLSFSGTICVELANGERSYVSRRCVAKIKKMLGL